MKHVEIFGFAGSTFVRTARMACEEKNVDYQLQPLEFGEDSHRALHPFLRMPVARIGKSILYETLAITTCIDEAFDGPALMPKEPVDRARVLQWISTCSDYLYASLVRGLLKEENVDEEALARARRDLEIVDRQLRGSPFLVGGEIYLCDLFLTPIIAFVESRAPNSPLFTGLEGIGAWKQRLWSRDSFAATAS